MTTSPAADGDCDGTGFVGDDVTFELDSWKRDRQTYRQTYKQTYRQTDKHKRTIQQNDTFKNNRTLRSIIYYLI